TLRGTEARAAWWKMTSTPRHARRTRSRSVTSPWRKSIPPRARFKFARVPVIRLSSTRTVWPRASRASTRWDPINPAPPVTRHALIGPLAPSDSLHLFHRDTFRQVARAVHVAAAQQGDVVGQ